MHDFLPRTAATATAAMSPKSTKRKLDSDGRDRRQRERIEKGETKAGTRPSFVVYLVTTNTIYLYRPNDHVSSVNFSQANNAEDDSDLLIIPEWRLPDDLRREASESKIGTKLETIVYADDDISEIIFDLIEDYRDMTKEKSSSAFDESSDSIGWKAEVTEALIDTLLEDTDISCEELCSGEDDDGATESDDGATERRLDEALTVRMKQSRLIDGLSHHASDDLIVLEGEELVEPKIRFRHVHVRHYKVVSTE